MFRQPHGAVDLVLAKPRVQARDAVIDDVLERLGQDEQVVADLARVGNGLAVGGEQDLGVQAGHLPQRRRPLLRVALDALAVAGVFGQKPW